MIKVNKKYLTKWINEQLPNINPDWSLVDINSINKNSHPTRGFVSKLIFTFNIKGQDLFPQFIYSYFTMKEIQDHLDKGYELFWDFGEGKFLHSSEINIRRKNN